MQEEWRPVPSAPGYEASDQGFVRNIRTQRLKRASLNGEGFLKTTLFIDGQHTTRAIAGLVADAFLDTDYDPQFNSLIHLDNRRSNCAPQNLARRPRWFAIRYHNQFEPHILAGWGPSTVKYREVVTGEVIEGIANVAQKYGLLCAKIYHSAANRGGEPVWPTNQHFVFDHW